MYFHLHLHACVYGCIQIAFLLVFKDARIVLIPISILIVLISMLFIRQRTISHVFDFWKIAFAIMKRKSYHKVGCCFDKLFMSVVVVVCYCFKFCAHNYHTLTYPNRIWYILMSLRFKICMWMQMYLLVHYINESVIQMASLILL